MSYQKEIDAATKRFDELAEQNGLDPVMSAVVRGLCRILEKRGMQDEDIASYLGSTANNGVPWVFPRATAG